MRSIDFSAGLVVNNSNLITGADIDIAAQPNGMEGAMLYGRQRHPRHLERPNGRAAPATRTNNFAFRAYSYRLVY